MPKPDPGRGYPIAPEIKAWIDQRMAWLALQFGAQRPRWAPVVLPTHEFFPDPYHGEEADAQRLLERLCGWMEIARKSVELVLYQDDRPTYEDRWQRSTSGLYQDTGGVYRIGLEVANLADPGAVVATLAHELAHVLLLGQGRISPDADDREPLADLLPVFFGLGIFSANAVIREHNWHDGTMVWSSLRKAGYLTMPMYGYALARFAQARGEDRPAWAKYLRPDVRVPFKRSLRYLERHSGSEPLIAPSPASGGWPKKAAPLAEEDTAEPDPTACKFCGEPLETSDAEPSPDSAARNPLGRVRDPTYIADAEPSPDSAALDDTICAACRASIAENQEDLFEEWQVKEARSEFGRKIWRWGCLTLLLSFLAYGIIQWLLSGRAD